jgi:hypothetical protein
MDRIVNRPFFSLDVVVIAALVVLSGWLMSEWLARALFHLLF